MHKSAILRVEEGSTLNRGRGFGQKKSKYGDLSKQRSRIDLYMFIITERVTVHMMLFIVYVIYK